MAIYDIPLSWNDSQFSGATSSSSVRLQNGGTLSNTSITDTGSVASVVGSGSFTLNNVRVDSREGVRIGGSGDIKISNSYLEATGEGSDHADTIQAYAPGGTGNVTITNTSIVAHNNAATAGMFVADDYAGSFTFDNVVFQGGPYGLRVHADERDITLSLKDVYFVGPFGYDPFMFLEAGGDIRITQWENVRTATIVNGELVPGALISPPQAVEGGGNSSAPPPVVGDGGPTTIDHFSNDSGTAGDNVTNDSTLTLTGSAAANSSVKVFDGTTQIGSATANSSGAWSYTTAALSDGAHSLTAKVGTGAASSALSVTVDTTAPGAPKIASLLAEGRSVAAGTTDANDVTLTGTAEANSTVRVFDGTKEIGTTKASAGGAWNYAANDLSDGSHSFTTRAVDKAGNTSTASAAVRVNVDTQDDAPAPTPNPTPTPTPGTGPVADFSNAWQTWSDKVVFKGTSDPYSRITIYDNGGEKAVASVKAGADGDWRVATSSPVSDNVVHTFTAKVTDSSGNTGASSGSFVLGTIGNDRLTGTSGNDLLKGNGGHDTFVFAPNFGRDTITDFGSGWRSHDVVQFSKNVFADYADVMSHASQSGRDVVIDAGGDNSLTLKNTKVASLDKHDFQFV